MDHSDIPAQSHLVSEASQEPSSPTTLNRRGLIGTSAAAIMGAALTHLGTGKAEAQFLGGGSVVEGRCLLMPADVSASLVAKFMTDPGFATLHSRFTAEGFQFIPERAKASMYLSPPAPPGTPPQPPCVHMILPSYRPVDPAAPSHEAVSIVGISSCDKVGGASAAKVIVGHNPYRLLHMSFFDVFPDLSIKEYGLDRALIKSRSVAELAAMIGPPPPPPPDARPVPGMSPAVMRQLANLAYQRLLLDEYARPNYPSSGLSTMISDSDMVRKWAEVQAARMGGSITIGGCSSSTSSNACTSTSTSIIIDIKF